MRTLVPAVLALLVLSGCTHRLDTPVVTDVTFDEKGRLMVKRCKVLFVGGFIVSSAIVLDQGENAECTFDRRPLPGSSAEPPPPVAPASSGHP